MSSHPSRAEVAAVEAAAMKQEALVEGVVSARQPVLLSSVDMLQESFANYITRCQQLIEFRLSVVSSFGVEQRASM